MGREYSTHGEMKHAYCILVRNSKGKNDSEHLGIDGIIISEWILRKQGGKL
jgi:hypothetical protein